MHNLCLHCGSSIMENKISDMNIELRVVSHDKTLSMYITYGEMIR